ncbi:ABC transporter permease [Runella rosea]|uniref:ABC transporter permease n=1 Tax=Runella rosea TaxID=2259595 RepID=A0A344TLT9_9BACT|nr:ABC transporter permease [Runella rosea]AXE19610.1 ABC transporter permease [Runella rosea]
MLRNYLKIAFRSLLKHKGFTFINIAGLSLGLTSFLVIALYVQDELGYDRFHQKADRIYRVSRYFKSTDGQISLRLGTVAPAFFPHFKNDFPEVEQITRLLEYEGTMRLPDNLEKKYTEDNLFFAEDNIFKVFDFRLLEGNPDKALSDPFTVVLSKPMAEKYFGNVSPVGKLIKFDSQYDFRITGVFEPLPAQSHIHPNVLFSAVSLNDERLYGAEGLRSDWGGNNFATYFLLPANYDPAKLEKAFPAFQDKHLPEHNGTKGSKYSELHLTKVPDIHLYSHLDYEIEPGGDIKYVYIFSAIALFILLIACINYMNLATARSASRAKEVGMRKAVGALRQQLIGQFLSESILVTFFALVLALIATATLLPALNNFTNKNLSFTQLFSGQFLLTATLAVLITGLAAGSYPAFFLTAYQPIQVLKGSIVNALKNGKLRQVLVITQFAIACPLIICTSVVYNQLDFMMNQKTGYKKEQILVMSGVGSSAADFETLKQQLKQHSGITNVTHSSRVPTIRLLDSMGASVAKGDTTTPVSTEIKGLSTDYDFINTYEIQLAAGRDFSRTFGADTTNFILNEAAIKAIGWKNNEAAIGQRFKYGNLDGQVVGVVRDFHFESLHQKIAPMVMFMRPSWRSRLSVSAKTGDLPAAIAHVEKVWKQFFPNNPFEYTFLDERFNDQYQAEQKQRTLFLIFAAISIFISCLGLFALATYTAEQRAKEIGIRKVLGASVGSVVTLLSTDFIKLVLIALLIASPVAWYAMHLWLKDFAYRIDIPWWVFGVTAFLAVGIAFLTVSFQSIKAALMNPVKSLKSE